MYSRSKQYVDVDVIVMGGGPAGSTASTLVSMLGYRVLLLEPERVPPYQMGPSLLPMTVFEVCRLIGAADELKTDAITVERGDAGTAYRVDWRVFDRVLLDNAQKQGVEVRSDCVTVNIVEEDGRVRGVSYVDTTGRQRRVLSWFVVDATGFVSRDPQARFWRPGLAVIGDTGCPVDPEFSSGMHLATYGALMAGRSVNTALGDAANETAAFDEFEARYRRECTIADSRVSFVELGSSVVTDEGADPVRPGGLVPSVDGTHWMRPAAVASR